MNILVNEDVERLVITQKDRLLRFGAELVFAVCEAKNVEVVIVNKGSDASFDEDLAQDMLEIITISMRVCMVLETGKPAINSWHA